MATLQRQSGKLPLRPLVPEEDEVRGMLTGLVARPEILRSLLRLMEVEVQALQAVLPWF